MFVGRMVMFAALGLMVLMSVVVEWTVLHPDAL